MPPKKKPFMEVTEGGPDFIDLISRVSIENFRRMVSVSGLTTQEVRELCEAFKELKA